jgi:hypothetical protein
MFVFSGRSFSVLLCFGMHLLGVYGSYVKSPISLQCMAGSRPQASRNKTALSSSNNRQVKQTIKNMQWHCGKVFLNTLQSGVMICPTSCCRQIKVRAASAPVSLLQ